MGNLVTLRNKLLKNSTINTTSQMSQSKIFGKSSVVMTPVPIINAALSADVDGGLQSGVLMLAAPSKHFKTGFMLLMASSFIKKYAEDAIILFYDSEFGSTTSGINSWGLDMDNIVHTPITCIEEFRHDIMVQLKELNRDDKVIIVVDSVGNLASLKEITDAEEGSNKADMTRAKVLKSLFRMVTPHLTIKDIPMIVVNHTYKEQTMYPRDIVSGGTGAYYSSQDIWIIGRNQDKNQTTKEINGYKFNIKIEKSRSVKEGSIFPVNVMFNDGIQKWSGMSDLALELGIISSTKKGYVAPIDQTTGEVLINEAVKESTVEGDDKFWANIMKNTDFKERIRNKYALSDITMIKDDIFE